METVTLTGSLDASTSNRFSATARRMRSAIVERLVEAGLREQDRELLAAEARGNVVVAKLGAEDLRDALEHLVADEMAVRVVDVAQQVEVGHDQRRRPLEALRARELLGQHRREVACVEEAGLRVDARLLLEPGHVQRAVDEQQRRERERDQPRIESQKAATPMPSAASTNSVESIAAENRPVSRGWWPRARQSIAAISAWFSATKTRQAAEAGDRRDQTVVRPGRRVPDDQARRAPRREPVEREVGRC